MAFKTENLVRNFRRAGPPALLAACLAVGPAFAQTTVVTQEPSVEKTETKIKEKNNGDVVVKQKEKSDDVTVKTKTKIDDDSSKTTTVVR